MAVFLGGILDFPVPWNMRDHRYRSVLWQELLMLGGIVAVILIVFFGSATLSANINRLRKWLVEF